MSSFWNDLSKISKPFMVLAPMDGVTDFVFREIIADTAKPDVFFTEFTNVEALLSKGFEKTINRLRFSEKQRYIVAQIWGVRPESFLKVGRMIKDLRFDGIDINMGCPDRAVMKIGSGAGHIKNPTLVAEIIAATKEGAGDLAVSVKTRIGIKSIVTQDWARFLLNQKIAALTIHARTAAELSKVPAHWDEVEKVVKIRDGISPETMIIGNGDIMSISQANSLAKEFGVDGVMVGTGIFANPWVFEKTLQNHTTDEKLNLLLKHTKLFCDTYSFRHSFEVMKKFFKIYVKSFPGADDLKKKLMETKNYGEVGKLVAPFISK